MNAHFCQRALRDIAPGELLEGEVSRWSSDSSECSLENNSDNDESEEEDTTEETIEQKLERHRRFFQGEALMRCMRDEEDKYRNWTDTIFYDNLLHEVQHGLKETRSQEEIQAYWKDVQEKMRIDDSEIGFSSTPVIEVLNLSEDLTPYLGSAGRIPDVRGWTPPLHVCPSSGKDLELQVFRDHLIDNKKRLGRAATFETVQLENTGDTKLCL